MVEVDGGCECRRKGERTETRKEMEGNEEELGSRSAGTDRIHG
jgi:hypothetical protein